jgi:hypothetical protein
MKGEIFTFNRCKVCGGCLYGFLCPTCTNWRIDNIDPIVNVEELE